jgi:hypothetical protein
LRTISPRINQRLAGEKGVYTYNNVIIH